MQTNVVTCQTTISACEKLAVNNCGNPSDGDAALEHADSCEHATIGACERPAVDDCGNPADGAAAGRLAVDRSDGLASGDVAMAQEVLIM